MYICMCIVYRFLLNKLDFRLYRLGEHRTRILIVDI